MPEPLKNEEEKPGSRLQLHFGGALMSAVDIAAVSG